MTPIQRIAQVAGWLFVVVAIWGAAVTGLSMDASMETADRLWGLFPVNLVHNLVHLAFGFWGLTAARTHVSARGFALVAGLLYLLLAGLGIAIPDGLGLVPLGGPDIGLHAVLGAGLLLAGLSLGGPGSDPLVEPAGTRTVLPPRATEPAPDDPADPPPTDPDPSRDAG